MIVGPVGGGGISGPGVGDGISVGGGGGSSGVPGWRGSGVLTVPIEQGPFPEERSR